jgi:hypothetical protein
MNKNIVILRILYPIWAFIGMYSILYVPSVLIDMENISLTVQNIQSHELLFRSGILISVFTQLMFILVAWYLWQLFNHVSIKAANIMLLLALSGVPIALLNEMNHWAVLSVLSDVEQVAFYVRQHAFGITLASVFWGLWLFPLAYLVYHSKIFPRWLAYTLYIAGLGYFMNACVSMLFPKGDAFKPVFDLLTIGEVIWLLWLTIAGARKMKT